MIFHSHLSYDELLEFSEQAKRDAHLESSYALREYPFRQPMRPAEKPLSVLVDIQNYLRNNSRDGGPEIKERFEPVALAGKGQSVMVSALGNGSGGSLRLEGRTDATFDPSFKTAGVKVKDAEGCSCEGKCIRAKGTLQANYAANIKVTLPRVSDYPDLKASQKKRFQAAVNNVLAPHEQKHVTAFRKYRGKTNQSFDITTCEDALDAELQTMFEAEEATRRQAVQDESDALDPFFFEFDL
jgi:hypothetical protein